MARWGEYTKGLHRVADGVYAWMQPPGSWGWNNTALYVAGGESLLVDTTVDLPTTNEMLAAMAAAEPAARRIGTVLLTHWHVDHVHGISSPALADSRIVASRTCAEYMHKLPPAKWLEAIAALEGESRLQMDRLLNRQFDFGGLREVAPSQTFEGRLDFEIGGKPVAAVEAQPCHTRSDTIVHLADAGVVHMGDLARADHHVGLQFPFMRNLLAICETALGWDASVYIPGHGPLMDKGDLQRVVEYLLFVQDATKRRYDRGLSVDEATDELAENLGPYERYTGAEGLWFTVKMLYCEFAGDEQDHVRRDYPAYLARQWRLHRQMRECHPRLFKQAA
jgi:glyoxylase-like metal-dependent hydrolase (beta-lactamase superfamily II)